MHKSEIVFSELVVILFYMYKPESRKITFSTPSLDHWKRIQAQRIRWKNHRMRPNPTNNSVEMSSRFGGHINAGFVRVWIARVSSRRDDNVLVTLFFVGKSYLFTVILLSFVSLIMFIFSLKNVILYFSNIFLNIFIYN